MDITSEQIKNYIVNDLVSEFIVPNEHKIEALAVAINHVADETGYESFALMQLLLENKPIDAEDHHIFQIAKSRLLIESMASVYYEKFNNK